LWFNEDAIDAWNAPTSGRPGGQRRYSDLTIVTALTLRAVLHLPLRQTEGFLASLIRMPSLSLETPDHTILSRRSGTVEIPVFARASHEPLHLAIDSTGLKIMGDGEWHAHKHRTSNKRRAWRKLHLAVDAEGFIVSSELTDSSVHGSSVGAARIGRNESVIRRFTADGAYDTRAIYEALGTIGAPEPIIVIPPRRTATPSMPADWVFNQRDVAIARIAEVGRRQWRQETGAHQQARAENGMYRYKRIIGDALRSRKSSTQKREMMIAVNVINRLTALGRPNLWRSLREGGLAKG